ncbi:MAG: LPS translocon maturation chaperone LptM [Pseudohongiellaceae bacterium]
MKNLFLLVLVCVALCGCGQKGPLLPPPSSQQTGP